MSTGNIHSGAESGTGSGVAAVEQCVAVDMARCETCGALPGKGGEQ